MRIIAISSSCVCENLNIYLFSLILQCARQEIATRRHTPHTRLSFSRMHLDGATNRVSSKKDDLTIPRIVESPYGRFGCQGYKYPFEPTAGVVSNSYMMSSEVFLEGTCLLCVSNFTCPLYPHNGKKFGGLAYLP